MAVFMRSTGAASASRTKRVTDPLDDKVKACICGRSKDQSYVSSGSEHEAHDDHDHGHDSSCLSDLIHGFLEEDGDNEGGGIISKRNGTSTTTTSDDFSEDDDHQIESTKDLIRELLNPIDSFRLVLYNRVSQAMEMYSSYRSSNKSVFRRKVMFHLREIGYNAGICKSKWESCGGLTAGNYEFIDVVKMKSSLQIRYFIDIDFSGEFEIARPTVHYEQLVQVIPKVFVGRSDELKQIVKLMCDAAKRSLKSGDLYLSPWRKNRFMQMKWFGPYKRTVNQIPSMAISFPLGFELQQQQQQQQKFAVKCQSIGFNVNVNVNGTNGRLVIPAATRSR